MDEHKQDDFNPIGTVWILVIYVILLVALWGYSYLEMILRS